MGATTTGDVPGRPCCQLTATLGLSLDDPASKEEPVRATRTGRQLVVHSGSHCKACGWNKHAHAQTWQGTAGLAQSALRPFT